MTGNLRLEASDARADIVIDRPDKRNAFNAAMWQRLIDLCGEIAENRDIRVVVVKSSSAGAFCAGADISEFDSFRHDRTKSEANAELIRSATRALQTLARPTIARIQGDCFGGGTLLALACDFRLAAVPCRFAITPARLGLSYAIEDLNTLVRTVGLPTARRLLMGTEILDAEKAKACGLVDEVHADAAELDASLGDLVERLRGLSQYSLRAIKTNLHQVINGATTDDDASRAAFADAFEGEDLEEGMTAFLEKRRPVFPFS